MLKRNFIGLSLISWLSSAAQVPVRQEPRHHNVFENNYVRILDVFLGPHDTTWFHLHSTPSVFTTFTKTATGSQLVSGQPSGDLSVAGKSWYDSLSTPRIHRVWNEDTVWFHVMDIELVAGKPRGDQPVLQDTLLKLYFKEPLANGYRLELQTGKSVNLKASPIGYLLLSIGDATIAYQTDDHVGHRIMKSGHYIWIEPGKPFSFSSQANNPSSFVLLQLK